MEQMAVKPALTPKEWEGIQKVGGAERATLTLEHGVYPKHVPSRETGRLVATPDFVDQLLVETPHNDWKVESGGRHATAALCLHDEPFGFTHEDVSELRRIADEGDEIEQYGDPQESVLADWSRLRGLADRIEALLPPKS